MVETIVHINVTSANGHDEYDLVPKEAVALIKKLAEEDKKWVFVGSERKNAEILTEDDLIKATTEGQSVTLLSALAGGSDMVEKPVEINVSYSKSQKHALVVDFVEDTYHKEVKISIATDEIYNTLRNRDIIVRAIKKKLCDKVDVTMEDMAKALNA